MAYASIARNNQAISATCPYGRPRTRDIGAICSPCQLHIASADPSLSETGRNLECYPTNRKTLSPLRGSSRSMASALVHFTRPSTNKLLRWVVRKWDAHAHLSTRQTYHGVCYFHGGAQVTWLSSILLPDFYNSTHFSLHQYLLRRHTSRLNLDPRPTPPQSSDR
jgi:hypothetical protein